jgi:hypothetical protein
VLSAKAHDTPQRRLAARLVFGLKDFRPALDAHRALKTISGQPAQQLGQGQPAIWRQAVLSPIIVGEVYVGDARLEPFVHRQ